MEEWQQELLSINDMPNHQKNLKLVLEAFLMSDYANCKVMRTDVLILFNHLKKLE